MKTTILICLLIISSNFCYSQEHYFTIEGIFDFRLGMTVEEFKAKVDTTLLSNVDIPNIRNGAQMLYLEQYKTNISKGLIIDDMTFAFYKDKLYAIIISGYDEIIESMLTEVYGESEEDVIERTEEYENTRSIWNTNIPDVICISSLQGNPKTNKLISYDLTIGYFSIINRWTLNGLYTFELGMSVEEMKTKVDVSQLEEEEIPFNHKTRSFFLESHAVDAEATYVLKNIELNFYENQLFQISIRYYDEDTENNLSKLYGKPEEEMEKKEEGFEECTYRWNTGIKNVHCYSKTMRNPEKRIVSDYRLTIMNPKIFMNSLIDPVSIESDMKMLEKWKSKKKRELDEE